VVWTEFQMNLSPRFSERTVPHYAVFNRRFACAVTVRGPGAGRGAGIGKKAAESTAFTLRHSGGAVQRKLGDASPGSGGASRSTFTLGWHDSHPDLDPEGRRSSIRPSSPWRRATTRRHLRAGGRGHRHHVVRGAAGDRRFSRLRHRPGPLRTSAVTAAPVSRRVRADLPRLAATRPTA